MFIRNLFPSPFISLTADCDGRCDKRSQDTQMRLYRLVSCIVLLTCISGCLPLKFPREDIISETQKEKAKSLIGESQESVIEKIGFPNQILTDGKHQYMIYEHLATSVNMMLIIVVPAIIEEAHEWNSLHCIKIDLDTDNMVVGYQFKSTTRIEKGLLKCVKKFWQANEWQSFEALPVPQKPEKPQKLPVPQKPKKQWVLKEGASWPNYGPPGSSQ